MGIVMKDKLTRCLLICLLATIILLPVGCTSGNKFANDPVNWSFVSGVAPGMLILGNGPYI